jgi:hypothetical protein
MKDCVYHVTCDQMGLQHTTDRLEFLNSIWVLMCANAVANSRLEIVLARDQ